MPSLQTPPARADSSTGPPPAPPAPPARRRRPAWALAALAALAVAGVIAAVLLITGGDDSDTLQIGEPRVVSQGDLTSYARSAERPVYWAGPAGKGFKLELTEVKGQRVFVRYLAADAKAGDPRPAFTTVATYPVKDAFEQLRGSADRPGAVPGEGPNGATTLYYKKAPSNVYVAYPDSGYLIEVYAPQPKAAQQIAGSDLVKPVR